jgi:hypothetical protein
VQSSPGSLKIQGGNREPRLWPQASRGRFGGRPDMPKTSWSRSTHQKTRRGVPAGHSFSVSISRIVRFAYLRQVPITAQLLPAPWQRSRCSRNMDGIEALETRPLGRTNGDRQMLVRPLEREALRRQCVEVSPFPFIKIDNSIDLAFASGLSGVDQNLIA